MAVGTRLSEGLEATALLQLVCSQEKALFNVAGLTSPVLYPYLVYYYGPQLSAMQTNHRRVQCPSP